MTAPLAQWAEEMIANGGYASISDLVRTALRRLEDDHRTGLAGRASSTAFSQPRAEDLDRLTQTPEQQDVKA
ncbi:ribbon-helix-helix domain-containing protein [Methylobacterium sp. J-088]|uniref:ribbon-helix-helix domain-containing protein n=1 Tax=Methylobacterium sp. J-088 TaxID=2836664 RepID=UPI001FB89804|nr:ribbon-helix-helix domain-containing protein [Methylobacterium sp. J-088]MCJ2064265.1 ribbon-helix-helix domain-containing protein [Methylobacterium sp. J-088]